MQRLGEVSLQSDEFSQTRSAATTPKELTLQDLLAILRRRRRMILIVAVSVALLAAVAFAISPRMYKGMAEVQVQQQTADALSLNTLTTGETPADALDANVTIQTEAQMLQSDSLALGVIKTLNLEHTPDFKPKFSPVGWVLGLFTPKGVADPPNASLEDSPNRRDHVLKVFESHLTAKPVAGTRLIDIAYYNSDPRTAAAVVNLLVQNLTDFNFETKHVATQQASRWLNDQLVGLRQQSQTLQKQLVQLQQESGVFSLGRTDAQGKEDTYAPVLDRLQQSNSHLEEAREARIMKGALYQVVKSGDPELISSLMGNGTLSGASPGVANSLTLLQNLRSQEAQTEAQYLQLNAKFGPTYPKLGELQASLDSTRKAIASESSRIASRVKNDYEVAQRIESSDEQVFQSEKERANTLNDKAVAFEVVRQEATQTRSLYEALLQRMKEADLVAGLKSTNITLVNEARVPSRPAKPNLLVYAGGGIVGGLLLGVCAGLFYDAMDRRIQDSGMVDALQVPLLGFLPQLKSQLVPKLMSSSESTSSQSSPGLLPRVEAVRAESMIAAVAPRAAYTEALRALRTTLIQGNNFSNVPPQVILTTSSMPGEGKSMLSLNLAIVFAQSGKRVLLVDGDLRTPVLHKRLQLSSDHGLSTLLSGKDGLGPEPERLPLAGLGQLDVMTAGRLPAYPAELLGSSMMAEKIAEWRTVYDYIFIDGAPLLPVTDSSLLSRLADYTLVVARHNKTDERLLERTCGILRAQGVQKFGVVLNSVNASGLGHFPYYGVKLGEYGKADIHA